MPRLEVIFLQTEEPTGPFRAKSIAEIQMEGITPAMDDATGVCIREVRFTLERVWPALRATASRGVLLESQEEGNHGR
jgi:putative selenate reductase molybdopterin-binding subunit